MAPAGTLRSLSPHGILILFTHLLIFMSSSTVSNGSEVDMQALLSFKRSIANDPRQVLSSWNRSTGFCSWLGVACGTALPPRVISLNLTSSHLSGPLSPWVANLTSLELVDLSGNQLDGGIPEKLVTLQHLRYLILGTNNLQGIIPRSLGTSKSLRYVDLSSNHLAGLIPEFHKLSALQFLDLSENNLFGSIPSTLGNVSSLTVIRLDTNSLSGSIPETLSLIQNLSVLNLANNSLSGHVSAKLCNILSLIYLGLADNILTGSIPPTIGNTLPNLERLSMSGNKFEGLIPSSLANASYLQRIDLGYNFLVGPVPSLGSLSDLQLLILQNNFLEAKGWEFLKPLGNCARLQILDMSRNLLNGSLPRSVGNLSTSVQRLNLGNNRIVGTIPIDIFNLRNLQMLALDQNLLSGVIPSVIGNLGQLIILILSGNKFSGQIPSTMGNLSRLNQLYLDSNGLSGNIPASLGKCEQLDMLDLSFNSLEGPIPSELVSVASLIGLHLSHNNLTGSIPLEIGALLHLVQLDISFNNLSGEVPSPLGECVQLSSLRLKSNMLNGGIPLSFSNLKSISQIDLSQNYLAGTIPLFFVDMVYLQQLDLSTNHFQGEIPTAGIFQYHSVVILDGNAGLCVGATITLSQFPPCRTTSAAGSKNNALLLVKVIPPVAIALISFICFMVTLLKRRQAETAPCYKETMKKISYGDIIKATNWLSPVNKISSSRTGSIYIGRFEFDTDLVAIKLFHLQENGARDSFVTECEVLRNTRHRNLVKAVTVCSTVDLENNEFKAIVFDFMANGSLDMWVHKLVSSAFPGRLGEVLDPHLSHEQQHACGRVFMRRYMVHLVEVALLCSMESPKDRPGMGEVCARILSIKEAFFEFC